jgi:hypothetical protein
LKSTAAITEFAVETKFEINMKCSRIADKINFMLMAVTSQTLTSLLALKQQKKIMKTGVFWDVTPCGSCKNRHLGGT